MAVSLREIKGRIRSVENTWKVTRAMQMISVSKLRRLQADLDASRQYFGKLEALFKNVYRDGSVHPFLAHPKAKAGLVLCVVASDSGLCGGYNDRMLKAAYEFITKQKEREVRLIAVGKKAQAGLQKTGRDILKSCTGFHGRLSEDELKQLCALFRDLFLDQGVGEVHLLYSSFVTAMINKPVLEQILPVSLPGPARSRGYLMEPAYEEFLDQFLPVYITEKVRRCLLEAFTSEHGERTVAMKSATDNAKKLIEGLVLTRNKVRQAGITKEVIEIISSAEALKG